MVDKRKAKIYFFTGVLYFATMSMCMSNNLIGPLLGDIMQHYSINLDSGGLISFFQNIGGATAIIILAFVMDKLNKPIAYMVPLFLLGAAMVLIGFVPPYVLFMLLFLIMGISISTIDMIGNAIIPDIHQEKRNAALSLLHGVAPVGALVVPLIAGAIVQAGIPWQTVYTLVGSLVLALCVLYSFSFLSARNALRTHSIQRSVSRPKGFLKKFFTDKRVWAAMGTNFFFAAFQNGIVVWVAQSFKGMFGSETLAAGLGLTAYWLSTGIFRVLFGVLKPLKKLQSRPVIIYGGMLAGIALAVGVVSGNYYVMLAGVFVAGAMNAPVLPLTVGLISGWYKEYSALASSAVFTAMYVAFAFFPLLMGAVAYAFGMQAMMFIPAVSTFLSGVVAIFLPKEKAALQ
ncbi:MAG: MFS transporter [Christensenellales bacterium]|jgi:MFS family permease